MSDDDKEKVAAPQSEPPEEDVDLRFSGALVRTALSSEQTLLAWVRTSLSMIGLGFGVTQFFHYVVQQEDALQHTASVRRLGLAIISIGVVVLILAIVEHVWRLRKMKEQGLPTDAGSFLPIGSAVGLLAIGVIALVSVFMNWNL
jgi:putative membrane protein